MPRQLAEAEHSPDGKVKRAVVTSDAKVEIAVVTSVVVARVTTKANGLAAAARLHFTMAAAGFGCGVVKIDCLCVG